jgi:hypothetical protein
MKSKTLVFSYKRFSSSGQKKGSSIARQSKMTKEWVDRHSDLILSEDDFTDEGISGFDGSNVRKGDLGRFLHLVKTGEIAKGSILVIEQWDRLTRQNPMDAIPLVRDILKAGVEIQTLYPEQRYSEKSARDPSGIQLMQMIFTLIGSYAESAKKSDRLKKAWEIKRKKISEGKKVKLARLPAWIIQDKNTLKMFVDEGKAKVVRLIFDLYVKKGFSHRRICDYLMDENIPPISLKQKGYNHIWQQGYITRILHDPSVMGFRDFCEIEKDEETGRKKIMIVDELRNKRVFPSIVDKEVYDRAQVKKITNFRPGREGRHISIFSLGLCRCGRCGEKMLIKFKGNNDRRYQCKGATHRTTECTCRSTYLVDELEMNFLRYVSEIDLTKFGSETKLQKTMEHLTNRDRRLSEEETKLQKSHSQIIKNMSDPDLSHLMPQWKREERSVSTKLQNIVEERRDVDTDMFQCQNNRKSLSELKDLSQVATAMEWGKISKDDRRQLRQIISEQVKRLVLFTYRNQDDFPTFKNKKSEWLEFLKRNRLKVDQPFQKKLRCAWVEFQNGEWRILRGIEKYYKNASHAVREPKWNF